MATITSLGSGSGLPLESLLTSLMAVERRPLTSIKNQSSAATAKISAFGALSSKLAALQTAAKGLMPSATQTALDKFASYTGTVKDTAIASASVSTGAVAGNYALKVSQLAGGQNLLSNAFAGGASAPVSGTSLTIDFGSMTGAGNTFAADGTRSKTIQIDSDNQTLAGVRNAINGANLGITATIINGANGAQLSLTGGDGSDQVFKLSGISELAFNPDAPTGNYTQKTTAQDAMFSLNGVAVTSKSNTVSGALDGVVLNLTATTTGDGTTLSVTRNNLDGAKKALEGFITAYNDAMGTMNTQGAYDPKTKVAGSLQGNRVLREAQTDMRALLFNTTAGGTSDYQRFSDIGVKVGTDGNLSLDSAKFTAAMAADPNAVANLVNKVGSAYNDSIERITGTSGSISAATTGLQSTIKSLGDRQSALELRLTTVEARYRSQFSALDTMMSKTNSTSSYLATQLANLAKTS